MDALIGHTGFVGANLAAQHRFDACFNSRNIEEAHDSTFELLVCAGVRAEKWIANGDEAGDKARIDALTAVLGRVKAERAVLISTTDVYADTRGRDEDHPVDITTNQPYGRNRALFELAFRERFPQALIVRLPGLFGPGIKKNVVHDLLKNHEVEKINTEGRHQYYGLLRLWQDIELAMHHGLLLLNIATPPLQVEDLAAQVFGIRYRNVLPNAADYDMHTRYGHLWGRNDRYTLGMEEVIADLRDFVRDHPERKLLPYAPFA